MTYKLLVMAHLLGAAVWIGGHIVLLAVILPAARRAASAESVITFERAFGKYAMGALILQVITGIMLASHWLGEWKNILSPDVPTGHLVLTKLALLGAIVVIAIHASHRILPRLTFATLRAFAVHAWIVTVLSILLLICGVAIRTGGLY